MQRLLSKGILRRLTEKSLNIENSTMLNCWNCYI